MVYQLDKEVQTATKAKDYDKALKLCDKIPDADSFVAKAGVYYRMGKDELVLEYLNKALSVNARCSNAYINRALYHRHNKNYVEAQKDYDRAIELSTFWSNVPSFNIVLMNEEDIFKYGKVRNITITKPNCFLNINGRFSFEVWLGTEKQGDYDINLLVEEDDMPYFLISKLYPKAIYSRKIMKFQYWLAERIFKFKTDVLKMRVRPLDMGGSCYNSNSRNRSI